MDILRESKDIQKEIIKWRRDLHQIPELNLELPKTVKYVEERLKEFDIPYETFVNGSAIVATIGNNQGKVIALRADMDALAMPEETNLDFASKNGYMHACGHDTHTAMLLGAAKLLKKHEDKINGVVKLFFQPGEEGAGGARHMVEEGVLENPKVHGFLALHIEPIEGLESGQVLIKYDEMMASADIIKIKVKGKGVHASMPELGCDPVTISAQVISAIQAMVTREFSALDSVVISLCSIRSKITEEEDKIIVSNVIPTYVEIAGTVRTLNKNARNKAIKRLDEVVKGICSSFNAEGTFECEQMCPVLVNTKKNTDLFFKSCEKLIEKKDIIISQKPIMGSEDAAFFLDKVPGTYFQIISNNYQDGKLCPAHNSKFLIDESMLYKGSALFVQGAIDFINDK